MWPQICSLPGAWRPWAATRALEQNPKAPSYICPNPRLWPPEHTDSLHILVAGSLQVSRIFSGAYHCLLHQPFPEGQAQGLAPLSELADHSVASPRRSISNIPLFGPRGALFLQFQVSVVTIDAEGGNALASHLLVPSPGCNVQVIQEKREVFVSVLGSEELTM